MSLLEDYSFHDSNIQEIRILNGLINIVMTLWNQKKIQLVFKDCYKLYYSYSSHEISDVIIMNDSPLLEQTVKETITDGDTGNPQERLISYSFIDSWSERTIIEIIACDMEIQ